MSTLAKKVKGIFYNPAHDEERNPNPNNDEQQQIVSMVLGDWEVFRPPQEEMHQWWAKEQRMYDNDHWSDLRSEEESRMRPNLSENVFRSQIESTVGKLCGWMPVPDFEEQEDNDKSKAADLNAFMPNELKQINFRQKFVRAMRRCLLHGPFILQTTHDPDFEGGRGMYRYTGRNDIVPVDLYSFFPDPRVTDFINLQKMAAIIVRPEPKTMEYFRKRFGKRGELVQPDNTQGEHGSTNELSSSAFNRDVFAGGTTMASTGTQTAHLLEYWYRGLPKLITREDREAFKDAAEEALERGADPSEYLAKLRGDMEGVHCIYISQNGVFLEHKAYIYDHGEYPFTARTLYPQEGSVWGAGFGRDMISLQIALNRFTEMAMETMGKQGNNAIMYEEGSITKPRTWQEQRSIEGAMLPIAMGGMDKVKPLPAADMPGSLFNMITHVLEMFQKVTGQYDSANGQADSRVTSGAQARALIAAAGTRLNTVSDLISESLQEVFRQYVELMVQFYTNERISRVNGRKVSISRASLISSVPTEYVPADGMMSEPIEQEMMPAPPMSPEGMMPLGEEAPMPDMMGDPTMEGMLGADPMSMPPGPQPPQEPEVLTLNEEFIPEFDIRVNIGVDKPQDREYWTQLGFNLLNIQDPVTGLPMLDGEGLSYILQTGRMESMDIIQRRIEERSQQTQQMQQTAQQAEQLQAENQQLQQALQEAGVQLQQMDDEDRQIERELKIGEHQLKEAKVAADLMKNGYQAPPLEPNTQQFDITQGSERF